MTVSSNSFGDNGLLSQELISKILAVYMRHNGPSTEEQLGLVLRAATRAAVTVTLLQMVLTGEVEPVLSHGDLAFRKRVGAVPSDRFPNSVRSLAREVVAL